MVVEARQTLLSMDHCTMKINSTTRDTSDGSLRQSLDLTLSFAQIQLRGVRVVPNSYALNATSLVEIDTASGHFSWIQSPELALRAVEAFKHAAQLCGAKAEPF